MARKSVVVLGAGMVGSAMALDLASTFSVTSVDFSAQALARIAAANPAIRTVQADLRQAEEVKAQVAGADFVVNAVPGFMGFQTLRAIIEAGKNTVDISFMPENSLELDALAKEKGLTVVVDCGVAPGMPNYCIAYWNARMQISECRYLVGGLPKTRTKPFEYKCPFSPVDVIEEYTRPVRIKRNGQVMTLPALSELEPVDFPEIGTLDAFNTDGIRTILDSLPNIPNITEKTLRYPGHVALVQALMRAGFFSKSPLNVKGMEVTPFDVTTSILFNDWKLAEGEEEFTVMRIEITGVLEGVNTKVVYDLLDRYCTRTKVSSMSRTTGYTATGTLNALAEGLITTKGVLPPEMLGQDERLFNYVLEYLKARNVVYHFTKETL